jgi:hypothetical protein
MICKKCRKDKHGKCKGGTWCDCQHRKPKVSIILDQDASQVIHKIVGHE